MNSRSSPAPARGGNASPRNQQEQHGLLATSASDDENDQYAPTTQQSSQRHSQLNDDGSSGIPTPRSANRVRFDLTPTSIPTAATSNGSAKNGDDPENSPTHRQSFDYNDDDDDRGSDIGYFDYADDDNARAPRRPLLSQIPAPSVALANNTALFGDADDLAAEEAADEASEWADEERRRPRSGLRSAFMNMANSIIGAGIIGQPYAFKQAGLLSGVILLLVLTVVVDWTVRLIVVNSKLSGSTSFQGTVEHCFGRVGLVAISVAQWAFAFGGMVAFCVIVGDSIPFVFRAVWPDLDQIPVLGLLADRRAVIVLFVMGVSYPLTLYRDISKLAKASTLALISMLIILVTVVVQGILTPAESRGSFTTPLLTINEGVFQAIGVISFAFVCHHNSLLIYGSLETPTMDRFDRVTHYSVGVSTLACMVMALAGFVTFGDQTKGNVLNNFPADNTMVTIARLCFGLNMLTTLPLEAFVCREVMLEYYFPGEPFNMNLHLIFSSSLVVAAMGISLITCDVGAVFDLVGATSACALAYILPPLCFIKLSTRSWKTYVAMGVVAFGFIVMFISMFQSIGKMIRGGGEAAQCM